MAIWNVAPGATLDAHQAPRALHDLARRLEADPVKAWEWIDRLQTQAERVAAGERVRGVVPTPAAIATRMAELLLEAHPPGRVLRVLDAGCGHGRLLVAVARVASERGLSVDCAGVDVDADAARWTQALAPLVRAGAGTAVTAWRVHAADFLSASGGGADCDAIIANPPYVPLRALGAAARSRLTAGAGECGTGDMAALFVARILGRLRSEGRMVVIVPNKLLVTGYAARLRKQLLDTACLETLWDLSDRRVFPGHGAYPVVLVARRTAAAPGHETQVLGADGAGRARWPQRVLAELPDQVIPAGMPTDLLPIVRTVLAEPRLRDRATVHCGIAASGFGRAIGHGAARILTAADVGRFRVAPARPFAPERAGIEAHKLARFDAPKIVVPGMFRRLCAAYDASGALLGRVYFMPLCGTTATEREAYRCAALALLNSRLYAVLYAALFGAVAQSGGYLRLNAPYLRALPWPARPAPRDLVELVPGLECGADPELEARLDDAVEDWFGLQADARTVLERLARNFPPSALVPDKIPRHGSNHASGASAASSATTSKKTSSSDARRRNFVGMDVA